MHKFPHVYIKKQSYHFQIDYPESLKAKALAKTFCKSLKLKVSLASRDQVIKAALQAHDAFELRCKELACNRLEVFSLNELEIKKLEIYTEVMRQLKAQRHTPISTIESHVNAVVGFEVDELPIQYTKQDSDKPDMFIESLPLSLAERAAIEVSLQLKKPRAQFKPETLSEIFERHMTNKEKDIDDPTPTKLKSLRASRNRLNKFLDDCGEIYINQTDQKAVEQDIHEALDIYVEKRENQEVTGSTIKREINLVVGAINSANRKYRLGLHIIPPTIRKSKAIPAPVIDKPLQKALLQDCLTNSAAAIHKRVTCLLAIQSGASAEEIANVAPEGINLDTQYPYIVFGGELKTDARKRVVPIVLGIHVIKEGIAETIAYHRRTQECSAIMKKYIQSVVGCKKNYTLKSLRHTFKQNADIAGANMTDVAAIAGWSSGSKNDIMNGYGREAIESSERLRSLTKTSLVIHADLISNEGCISDNNVVAIQSSATYR